jgi:hypothetical protein
VELCRGWQLLGLLQVSGSPGFPALGIFPDCGRAVPRPMMCRHAWHLLATDGRHSQAQKGSRVISASLVSRGYSSPESFLGCMGECEQSA